MDFSNKLNNYINIIKCTYKELAKASNLSESTISRYCNGTRIPTNPSEQLNNLINGLLILIEAKNIQALNKEIICKDFNTILKIYDFDKIINNFNQLVHILKINISEFSKVLGFDSSYLSRIRSGKRKPADPEMFFEAICNYIVNNYNDDDSKKVISSLLTCSFDKINTNENYKKLLSAWLSSDYQKNESKENIGDFLIKLDNFDLNEYINVIHFDELKIPTIPFNMPKSKNYYGIKEMKQGEIDFFKSTVLSKSSRNVFMCSDMQMDDMAKDIEFGKKWMIGIAVMLKKGLHLDVIHNIDRPFNEMMLGLESWIPIYMTGQVSPYYLSNTQNNIYSHLNYISDDIILTGECIKGYHDKGKYYLTNNRAEIEYFKQKSDYLLKKAHPLMKIYRKMNNDELNLFLDTDTYLQSNRKNISSSLPIYTISDKLLFKILERNNITDEDIKNIFDFVKKERMRMSIILEKNHVQETVFKINKNEFKNHPIILDLAKLFYSKKITYNYDEYLNHFKSTKKYEVENNNYSILFNKNIVFKNINISILFNNKVIISKMNNPEIHFVIEHPKLCKAIENFIAPVIEKEKDY